VWATKTVLAEVEIVEGTKRECISLLFLVLRQDLSSSLDHHTRFRGNNIKQNIPQRDPRKQEQGRKTRNFLGEMLLVFLHNKIDKIKISKYRSLRNN
jgi:hypothetical protein